MRQRVLYLLKFYLVTVCIFVVAKIFFMLYNQGNHDFSFIDILQVVRHGASLDLSTSLYLFPFHSFWSSSLYGYESPNGYLEFGMSR